MTDQLTAATWETASTVVGCDLAAIRNSIQTDGFALLGAVYGPNEVSGILERLTAALDSHAGDLSIRGRDAVVYAARNVTEWFDSARNLWRNPLLIDVLRDVLGRDAGLVRVLYFDKPPAKPWSLAWHKDLTIAVRDNTLPSPAMRNPTTKVGIPHVEAPTEVLERMLTLRVHLDEINDQNGPLLVAAESHRTGKAPASTAKVLAIHTQAGDVLAMRPLLCHSSPLPQPNTRRHRRILHFEFAAGPELPDEYQWRMFDPVA